MPRGTSVGPRTRHAVVNRLPRPAKIKPLALLRKGATIYGDVALLSKHFVRAIRWLETKKVSGEKLITKRFALDHSEEAFKVFHGGETIRVLFEV